MIKKIAALAIVGLALAGCEETKYPQWEIDRDKWAKSFQDCMASLPAGPVKTVYNDWDEVVAECRSTAQYVSYYCTANCPPKPDEVGRPAMTSGG